MACATLCGELTSYAVGWHGGGQLCDVLQLLLWCVALCRLVLCHAAMCYMSEHVWTFMARHCHGTTSCVMLRCRLLCSAELT
eukprot:6824561-Pyramimonas_sp.AAC.1